MQLVDFAGEIGALRKESATCARKSARCVSLAGAGDLPALLDADGSAVIIHELPDDHRTQPIGGAGGRIACGIISDMPEMTR